MVHSLLAHRAYVYKLLGCFCRAIFCLPILTITLLLMLCKRLRKVSLLVVVQVMLHEQLAGQQAKHAILLQGFQTSQMMILGNLAVKVNLMLAHQTMTQMLALTT